MAKIKRHPMPWTTVYCDSDTAVFLPATPWMAAADVDKVRCTFEVQGRLGDNQLSVRCAYETANTENSASSATEFGQTATSGGISYANGWNTNVATDTADQQLIRFGWRVWRQGNGLILARVAGLVEIATCD